MYRWLDSAFGHHGTTTGSRAAISAKDHNIGRAETIKRIALSADLSGDTAGRVMDVFAARLQAHTGAGKRVVLRGVGNFSRGLPGEKAGRNVNL